MRPTCRSTNTDNDAAGITVSPTSGLVTTEAGGTATFTVEADLAADGQRDDRSVVQRHDGRDGLAGEPDVHGGNWNTAQTVTVTGVDDQIVDGNVAYTIVTAAATSSDTNYNGLNAADVAVTNTDNDTAGITVTSDQRVW